MAEGGIHFADVGFAWPGASPLFSSINLYISPGSVTALVGASGCGKSTLLRLAAGLLTPTSGRIETPPGPRAFVFQAPTLLPWRTVAENVRLPLELSGGLPPEEGRARVEEALSQVGLAEAAGLLPRALSGGMQMRTSLARALATRPTLMLLDEPFGALDALTRRGMYEIFLSLRYRLQLTALLVTHDIDEAALLSDRILVIGRERPAPIRADIPVDLPHPRTRAALHDPALGELAERVEALC